MKNKLKNKKTNFTHFKALLLALVVMFSALAPSIPVKADIWDYEKKDGFFYEVMKDGNINIIGYYKGDIQYNLGPEKSLTIPKELDGKKVTRISAYMTNIMAKSYFHGLKEIIIPDTVTYIGEYAFYNSKELENVVIPDSVTWIGQFAFSGCDGLTSVTIPGVEHLGAASFSECDNLKTAIVSDGPTAMYATFKWCPKLKNVTLPSTLKELGSDSLHFCDSLKKITIPKSVTLIEEGAFDYRTVKNIYYEGTKTQWEQIDISKNLTKWFDKYKVKVHYGKAVPESVKLSETSYVYDGKAKKPTVTVKDSDGKIVNKKYYKVSYSNNKKVGQATITVTFKDKYKGTVLKENFKIVPKKTKIAKVKAASKGFIVNWKKQKTQTSGYEIQYATNSNFKNAKKITVKKNTITSKKMTELKAKKTYYVRVRTYKNVKVNGKSKKIYSAWSKKQTVTTKK